MIRTRFSILVALAALSCGVARSATEPGTIVQNTAPMDLTSGKTNSAAVSSDEYMMGTVFPLSPPQTVEGTLVSIDPAAHKAVIRTLRDGDVKIGLPEGIVLSRNGRSEGCSLNDVKPGDRVYATVVTANGNRALRLVSEDPANPMVNYVGIPVLSLLALVIWRIRCKPLTAGATPEPVAKPA